MAQAHSPLPAQEESQGEPRSALAELHADPASRKRFLSMMGGAGAASAFSLFLTACGGGGQQQGTGSTVAQRQRPAPRPTDMEIVNYALTLEYLEADFYEKVQASGLVSGAPLEAIRVIGEHEREHVQRLKSVAKDLGKPVKKPQTRFPLQSQDQILKLASTFENLGAAAYPAQAPNIRSKELLSEAISIATVEARHAAKLNELTGKTPTPDGAFQTPLSMPTVLAKASPYIVTA